MVDVDARDRATPEHRATATTTADERQALGACAREAAGDAIAADQTAVVVVPPADGEAEALLGRSWDEEVTVVVRPAVGLGVGHEAESIGGRASHSCVPARGRRNRGTEGARRVRADLEQTRAQEDIRRRVHHLTEGVTSSAVDRGRWWRRRTDVADVRHAVAIRILSMRQAGGQEADTGQAKEREEIPVMADSCHMDANVARPRRWCQGVFQLAVESRTCACQPPTSEKSRISQRRPDVRCQISVGGLTPDVARCLWSGRRWTRRGWRSQRA